MSLLLAGCAVLDKVLTPQEETSAGAAIATGEPLTPLDNNRFVLRDGDDVIGELQVIRIKHEDTFVDIARSYGLGFDELVAANPGVDPWLPGEDELVLLPTRFVLPDADREGIVLNIAAKRLYYFPDETEGEERVVETFPIGIGREGWATPTGDTSVISKARDPVWFVPASVRKEHEEMGDPLPRQVPPGPDNPLGDYVLGLGIPGYLLHGTNKPAGVGMRVSHGCVRLFPEHIESLYPRIDKGVRVRIVNQPYVLGRKGDELLLEAHPPLIEDQRAWLDITRESVNSILLNQPEQKIRVVEKRVENIASEQLGVPLSVTRAANDKDTAMRAARYVENIVVFDKLADYASD